MWSCYSTFGVISRGRRWLAGSFSFAGVASFSPFAQLRNLRGTGATLIDGSTFCLTDQSEEIVVACAAKAHDRTIRLAQNYCASLFDTLGKPAIEIGLEIAHGADTAEGGDELCGNLGGDD
jgi:hypothetical protein